MAAETLPRLLQRSAETHGDKVAFRFGDDELSYGALAVRANQLANALRADGVRRGDLVGVLMGKGLENAVAVYGIMAAGAAYVPLDPAAPVAALERVAAGCDLRHLVIDAERRSRAAKLLASTTRPGFVYGIDDIDLDSVAARSWDHVARHEATDPGLDLSPRDRAYLIFTSGSTGTPKGIVHTHGSGVAYAEMAARLYGLTAEDRLSNFPPLHFDQSTFDFFSGPLVGATTVIIGPEHQLVPASLSQLIERERLTIWYSVPLALVQLVLYGVLDERDCSSLRWVVYGGEPFPLKHLKALMDRWPQARFSNCYGPAETNQCTYHHLEPLTDAMVSADAGVPIGTACPGADLLVVDDDDSPVAVGETGQLLVNSPTMMQGYWGREDLNDRIFFHPAGVGDRRRYYRTGDLVRENTHRQLEFLGRGDRQIKTRGFRVELDEVEAVLSTHEAIEEAAVTTVQAEDGVAIAAHVSLRPDTEVDTLGLQRHVSARLPRYAVPSAITFVEDFPRTTSGKIDYRALGGQR